MTGIKRWPNFNELRTYSPSKIVSIDIESTLIKPNGHVDKIWCISWHCPAWKEPKSVYWRDGVTYLELSNEFANASSMSVLGTNDQSQKLAELRDILTGETDYVPNFHNSSFDKFVLSQCVDNIRSYHDTFVLAYVLFPPSIMGSRGDEDALRFYSLAHLSSLKLCSAKLDYADGWDSFSDEMLKYNRQDAVTTSELASNLIVMLMDDPQSLDAYIIDLCATEMCMHMKENGVHVNTDGLLELQLQLEEEIIRLVSEMRKYAPAIESRKETKYERPRSDVIPLKQYGIHPTSHIGLYCKGADKGDGYYYYRKVEEFNPQVKHHLVQALRGVSGWEPKRFGKSGVPSVDKSVLYELGERDVFAQLVLEYKKYSKLLSTYILPLQKTDELGRVYPSFLVCATRTSRLASRNPNFQNIPRDFVRQLVSASPGGYKLVCIDLSQIELRILGWYMAKVLGGSDDSGFYFWRLYEANADVHAANQEIMGGVERKLAKIGMFLYVYGGRAWRLATSLGIDFAAANEIIRKLEKNVPALPKLKDLVIRMADAKFVLRTLYGHKIAYPDLKSNDPGVRAGAERQYFNAKIQGTQADIIKILMWQCRGLMDRNHAKLLMQVHDELVFEVPEGNAVLLAEGLKKIFNNRTLLPGMKVQADPGIGDTWKEAKEDGEK